MLIKQLKTLLSVLQSGFASQRNLTEHIVHQTVLQRKGTRKQLKNVSQPHMKFTSQEALPKRVLL